MKPSWDDAPMWARFVGMDDSGRWYWYEKRPKWDADRWMVTGGEYQECILYDDNPGNGSLESRP